MQGGSCNYASIPCLREFKRGSILEGEFSEDFGPVVARWAWGLGDRPELSEGMMDEGDGGALGGGDVPAWAQKVDLVVGGQGRVTVRLSATAFSPAALGLRPVVRQTVAFCR